MKKLLRLILIFLVFALMAALSAITALACSPEDSNPEHHENIIQTDEEKPTCLMGGYYVLECTVCGMRCTYQTDPAMPHSFGPWEVVQGKEPTCTQSGTKRAYCSTCNKWYEMPAPPTDHFWVIDSRVFATCTTSGYTRFICDDCGTEGDTITMSALGHKFGAWFTTTQPTCMETGIQKRECTQCGVTETKPIAKTDHKFGAWFTTTQPTCMEKGIQTRECTYCGVTERREAAKTDHNWDAGKVVAQPTTSQEGVMQWICNMCSTIRTKPIPKLKPGTTAAPRTTPTPAPTAPPRTSATATPKVTSTPKVTPTASPHTSATASPTASPNAAASASPGISPTASPGASISGTADSDGKNGDRGEKNGFGVNTVGKDVPQKNEKNNVQAAERSFSVGTILVCTLVPTLLIVAVVVFLLVWRKKKRQV
ncbi:MAG: hypothetical protein ACLUNH_02540 [Hominenteromicrobium sp.]|uniref:hypothetical protein n=1 Tax=Hominenteromicrobium sp. TaxID=3073581 RepID=UPI003994F014